MRRRFIVVVVTTALGICPVVATRLAGAASSPSCTTTKGTWTFSPMLPRYGTTAKVSPVSSIGGSLDGCGGGGVTSGTITFSSPKPKQGVNCTTFKSYDTIAVSGTLTVTWNTKAKSIATISLRKVKGKPTQRSVNGSVTKGPFAGSHLTGLIGYTLSKGSCTSTSLKSVSIKNVGPLAFSAVGPSR